MEDIVTKAVLFDYFSGRVSPLQKKSVENWLSASQNRSLYYQWLHEWELSHLQASADWQRAYEKTALRIDSATPDSQQTDTEPAPKTRRINLWNNRFGLIAASVSLMLLLSGWLFQDTILYQTVHTGYGEIRSLTLPDGSAVTLNANSSLRFRRWFGMPVSFWTGITGLNTAHQNPRLVELTGEADFLVKHLPTHQRFIVTTAQGLDVVVLGTEFTVFSRNRGTRVALRSGRVQLTTQQKTGPALIMHPGDLATLNRQGKLALSRTAHPEAIASWKDHRFSFEQTPLRDIAEMLHDNYGLTVTIANSQLASRTISGSFTAQNANDILQLIAQLLQINYIRNNDHVSFND